MQKGRKRRISDDEDMTLAPSAADPSFQFGKTLQSNLRTDMKAKAADNSSKRTKTDMTNHLSVRKLLDTLDKTTLVDLVNGLIDSYPSLQPEIEKNIPAPTLQSVSQVINDLEYKLSESFPYSRSGPIRDDYSYNRVKGHLMDLVNALQEYADHFTTSSDFPTTTFSYLHFATLVAERLPTWSNPTHNNIQRNLYLDLVKYWMKAIEQATSKIAEGKIYGEQVVTEWAKNLMQHNSTTNGLFSEAIDLFANSLGWIIGFSSPSERSSAHQSFSIVSPTTTAISHRW
ncbi:Cut8 six-helix bundle-domain-containing protein [Umbelopsis sp. AD052]|nr:Cut8 six-helix bundle-domain-containing protein [Umbelopsis sp. AD052]